MNKNYDGDFCVVEKNGSKSFLNILISNIIEWLNCKTVVDFGCDLIQDIELKEKLVNC